MIQNKAQKQKQISRDFFKNWRLCGSVHLVLFDEMFNIGDFPRADFLE